MKKKLGAIASIALAALALVGCGDDGGASAPSGENANSVFHETMTDDRDGRTYKTVVIGAQTWMAENLDYEYKANDSTYGNWCYGNSADNCAKYGRLYSWAAAMDSATTGCGDDKACTASSEKVQGICPDGWHLPSKAEWDVLFTAVGGSSIAGTALKTSSGWTNGGNGSDTYGFSALPSGNRTSDGETNSAGNVAYFWSSSESAVYRAYSVVLNKGNGSIYLANDKGSGFAVRCVKD